MVLTNEDLQKLQEWLLEFLQLSPQQKMVFDSMGLNSLTVDQLREIWKVLGPHDADTTFRLQVAEQHASFSYPYRKKLWVEVVWQGLLDLAEYPDYEEATKDPSIFRNQQWRKELEDVPPVPEWLDLNATMALCASSDTTSLGGSFDTEDGFYLPCKDPTLVTRSNKRQGGSVHNEKTNSTVLQSPVQDWSRIRKSKSNKSSPSLPKKVVILQSIPSALKSPRRMFGPRLKVSKVGEASEEFPYDEVSGGPTEFATCDPRRVV